VDTSNSSLSNSLLQSARAVQAAGNYHGLPTGTAGAGSMLGVPASVTLTLGQAAAGPARGVARRGQVRRRYRTQVVTPALSGKQVAYTPYDTNQQHKQLLQYGIVLQETDTSACKNTALTTKPAHMAGAVTASPCASCCCCRCPAAMLYAHIKCYSLDHLHKQEHCMYIMQSCSCTLCQAYK
jgi:hypothetical protein